MRKGDIVLTPFPFTDLSGAKVRPALVVSSVPLGDDVLVAFISSQRTRPQKTDVMVGEKDAAFNETGLKRNSIIKLAKLATLEKKVVLGKLGNLDKKMLGAIDDKLRILFGI